MTDQKKGLEMKPKEGGKRTGSRKEGIKIGQNEEMKGEETHLVTHLVWPHQQKTHRGSLGLGESVHEEAHPCFPCFIQPSFKSIDAGSIYHPLVQLIQSINHSV